MKLPRELVIGDSIWRVKFLREVDAVDARGKTTLGFCNEETHTIEIKTRLQPECRLRTLIHEVLHCIESEYGLEIPHRLVYALEEPIYRLLVDNFF